MYGILKDTHNMILKYEMYWAKNVHANKSTRINFCFNATILKINQDCIKYCMIFKFHKLEA